MKPLDRYKRDNIIVEIIRNHTGLENAITGEELSKILSNKGFEIEKTTLRNHIERIRRERCLPIWYKKNCGYFCIGKSEEAKEAISMLRGTVSTLQDTIKLLQRFIVE